MGNRAVIQFGEAKDAIGIYLHWNGGPESVAAFLAAAEKFQVRPDDYGVAKLCQIIGNFLGGTLSLGVGLARNLDRDNGDNGTYIVKDWKVVKLLFSGEEVMGYDVAKFSVILEEVVKRNQRYFNEHAGVR